MTEAQKRGYRGEQVVAAQYRNRGCAICTANFRVTTGELDLVVYDGKYLRFVEVKTRKNKDFGYASQAVDRRKQQKMILGARCFLNQNKMYHTFRFDVIEVYGEEGGDMPPEIDHIMNVKLFPPNWRFW
jgi:putative endonuclease